MAFSANAQLIPMYLDVVARFSYFFHQFKLFSFLALFKRPTLRIWNNRSSEHGDVDRSSRSNEAVPEAQPTMHPLCSSSWGFGGSRGHAEAQQTGQSVPNNQNQGQTLPAPGVPPFVRSYRCIRLQISRCDCRAGLDLWLPGQGWALWLPLFLPTRGRLCRFMSDRWRRRGGVCGVRSFLFASVN